MKIIKDDYAHNETIITALNRLLLCIAVLLETADIYFEFLTGLQQS